MSTRNIWVRSEDEVWTMAEVLSEIDNISVGDDVVYFGEKRPIWDLANELNTIPYEITSTLSRRIKRIYI